MKEKAEKSYFEVLLLASTKISTLAYAMKKPAGDVKMTFHREKRKEENISG